MLQFTRRCFSSGLGKVTFNTSTLEGRYSSALYSAAVKQGSFEKIEKDVVNLSQLLKSDLKLTSFLDNPSVEKAAKTKTISEVLRKQGISELTVNFVGLVGGNGRITKLASILESYLDLVRQQRGDASVTITSVDVLPAHSSSFRVSRQSRLKRYSPVWREDSLN